MGSGVSKLVFATGGISQTGNSVSIFLAGTKGRCSVLDIVRAQLRGQLVCEAGLSPLGSSIMSSFELSNRVNGNPLTRRKCAE